MSATSSADVLLRIRDLRVHFHTDAGVVRAVDGVDLDVGRGETLAVVGESGCGKSVTALAVMRLVEAPGRIEATCISFDGEDLLAADEARMRAIRGNDIAMIFQEPMTSLNPVYTVGDQIGEALELHRGATSEQARAETIRLLERVGIPDAGMRADDYPHQMSGGMRQRVMIAMALACDPKLLIADEPSTALDVTIQAQILELLSGLQQELDMSVLLITHDLGVVAQVARRAAVMYAGRVVERGAVEALFERPRHPYTAGLLRSIPRLGVEGEELRPIEGMVPDALDLPAGCRFAPRCAHVLDRCRSREPELAERGERAGEPQASACFAVDEAPALDLLADPGRDAPGRAPG